MSVPAHVVPRVVPVDHVMSRSFVVVGAGWSGARAKDFLAGARVTHVVVLGVDGDGARRLYLHSRRQLSDALAGADDTASVQQVLDRLGAVPDLQLDAASDAAAAPPVAVVVDGAAIVGFVDAREPAPAAARRSLSRLEHVGDSPPPFRAYPELAAPEAVQPGQPFDLVVGFRPTPDPSLGPPAAIEMPAPARDDPGCLVLLSGDGVDLDRDHGVVALRDDAVLHFTAKLRPGLRAGVVKVLYVHAQQVIGSARREIRAADTEPAVPREPAANPCRMGPPEAGDAVDLTVAVRHQGDGTLEWHFVAPACPGHDATLKSTTRLSGSSEYAADLMRDLRAVNFRGPFGKQLLEAVGDEVAALIPPRFFELLRAVHAAIGRTPTLLWLTDEAYVPWELAALPAPLDPAAPPFLAAQTFMGRWLINKNVMLPPRRDVEVLRLSAVASAYGLGTGQRALAEAVGERDELCLAWKGQPFEATRPELSTLASGAKLPGHLVHFAVHGHSDPVGNAQSLLLADRTELPARALVGGHHCGELPRFVFVFLNACQVGTPGRSLGQAAGFPAALLRGGTAGVIAPLWDVDDALARKRAKAFYEDVFQAGLDVGEAMQRCRRSYDDDATTPLAYIFYGHPALALRRV